MQDPHGLRPLPFNQSPLWLADLPALLAFFLPEPQGLLPAELPTSFRQRHGLIGQQFTAGDLEPLAPAIPESGPEVEHLAAVADPGLTR
jgi:hypothetical protein